jgi:hypothetical protein
MPREQIEPKKGDKRYVRRGAKGQVTEGQVEVGRSLAADARRFTACVCLRHSSRNSRFGSGAVALCYRRNYALGISWGWSCRPNGHPLR